MFSNRTALRIARFASRPNMRTEEIFLKFFSECRLDPADFEAVWDLIAFHLGIPAGQLRPTDRFDSELKPEKGAELLDEIEDLTVFVRAEAEKRGKQFDLYRLHTLSDLVMLLVNKK
jgi:hypothetical protein